MFVFVIDVVTGGGWDCLSTRVMFREGEERVLSVAVIHVAFVTVTINSCCYGLRVLAVSRRCGSSRFGRF